MTQGGGVVNTLGYLERLERNDPSSQVWWDSSPAVYQPYKQHLLEKYPAAATYIEALMPDDFSQPWGLCSVTTNPRLVTAVILEKREYWSSRFNLASLSPGELRKQLYNEVIIEGAATLQPRWVQSAQAEGWICAQVDPVDVRCTERMTIRGLELQRLAPNVMSRYQAAWKGWRPSNNWWPKVPRSISPSASRLPSSRRVSRPSNEAGRPRTATASTPAIATT